jgi:hypothetical protein
MRGKVLAVALASILLGLSAPGLMAQQAGNPARVLEISFDLEGRVTLVAENVTLREILSEWGRAGGSYMINADRLANTPVRMMRFENRPEREVIDSLLRSAAGYILGPRTVRTSGPSRFEAVMILPTSTPVATGAYSGLPTPAAPFQTPGSPDDEIPPVVPAIGVPAPEQPAAPAQAAPANSPPGVFVPIVPVTPVTPVTGGRGRGGGGGR